MATKLTLDREAIIRALKHLEAIVPSIDRIGSASASMPDEEHDRLLAKFFEEWNVGPRLAEVRKILSEAFDYDEYEKLFEDIPVWSEAAQKPPS